jgi:polyhydroxybutyrate depolymerase
MKSLLRNIAFIFCLFIKLASAGSILDDGSYLDSGSLNINSMERTYEYYQPTHTKEGTQRKMLIFFHGGGDSVGVDLANTTLLHKEAENLNMIVVYPNGTRPDGKSSFSFNDGRPETNELPDDVVFTKRIVAKFVRNFNVNPDQVFIGGLSNGGMMAQRAQCELPNLFRGVISVIANMPVEQKQTCSKQPQNLMLLVGTSDSLMPFNGGEILSSRRKGYGGKVLSSKETLQFFLKNNGCDEFRYFHKRMPDLDEGDGVQTFKYYYLSGCSEQKLVYYYEGRGGNHAYPSLGDPGNPAGNDYSATKEIKYFIDKVVADGL